MGDEGRQKLDFLLHGGVEAVLAVGGSYQTQPSTARKSNHRV